MKMITRYGLNSFRKLNFKASFHVTGAIILLAVTVVVFLIVYEINELKPRRKFVSKKHRSSEMDQVIIRANFVSSAERNTRCSYYSCFNPYKCGRRGISQIQVYVYPMKHFLSESKEPIVHSLTREFNTILETVKRSKFYTPSPDEACIFIPPFDTLSQTNILTKEVSQALNMLP